MGGEPRCSRKKLIAWARWITAADGPGPEYCGACMASRRCKTRCGECLEPMLLPECEDAVELFCACDTQWVYSGMNGVRTGLDYAGVQAAARMLGVREVRRVFEGVRIIERAVLAVDRERAALDRAEPIEGKTYRGR